MFAEYYGGNNEHHQQTNLLKSGHPGKLSDFSYTVLRAQSTSGRLVLFKTQTSIAFFCIAPPGAPLNSNPTELLAEVEAEKRAKGKKGKKKKKGGGSGGAGPSQESEAPAEAAAAKPAPLDREGLLKLLAELHEDRIRFGITPETSGEGAGGGLAHAPKKTAGADRSGNHGLYALGDG
ncbi:hypothetical protein EMIHUDRAFT_225423 [Emiliania huxleyi CCMP1516]|uniref:Uncharacterized protein n=2 Tax=Emiliania huxleyi TaxID=2903 RepID=A0A0D3KP54_EMIH1|nr:hypothetical protein EMIHUDRAFT_225423 [Emiliania huxleyi CCMP1516]EOD37539.1 hypothetical protein EMIHUDRAFT_225423 [Emiliania huxleyi CCMP1516]|eukprot:XP_005789968.1 hypothetical protein EMIHUDRAFT_225423 [Emiliania huxleyi CCMP1516]